MLSRCDSCQGTGKSQCELCPDCGGMGHVCDASCNPEDENHKLARLRAGNQKLREEVMILKKEFERRRAQLVTLADQSWEMAKDKVGEMSAVRDKINEGVVLNERDLRVAAFALTLVSGEARLRKAGY